MPDIFFLGMSYRVMGDEQGKNKFISSVWITFLGGLLWDMRWTSVPGITALGEVLALTLICVLWYRAPSAGRTPLLWAFMAGGAHLFLGLVRFLLWADTSSAALRLLTIQQLTAVPLILMFSAVIFFKRMKG